MLPTRKRDCAYLIFFATHIPIIFLIDTVPLLPPVMVTSLSHTLRDFYITTYRDKFFSEPPTWFTAFIWMELLYHVPLSLWAVWGLLRGEFPFLFRFQPSRPPFTCLPDGVSNASDTGTEESPHLTPTTCHLPRWAGTGIRFTSPKDFVTNGFPNPNLDHPLVPVQLLIFGVQAFVTSLTCLVEVWNWPDRSVAEKQQITSLYGPYVALGMSFLPTLPPPAPGHAWWLSNW